MKLLVVAALLCGLMILTTASRPREHVSSGDGRVIPTAKSYPFNVSSHCPPGWTYFNSRCFVYVPLFMNWEQADEHCFSMRAHLASVHSTYEHHVIQQLTAAYDFPTTWIGGTYKAADRIWRWSDRTPFDYKNWCPGEPSWGNQNCLQMNYSVNKCWDNLECDARRPSVCAKATSALLG